MKNKTDECKGKQDAKDGLTTFLLIPILGVSLSVGFIFNDDIHQYLGWKNVQSAFLGLLLIGVVGKNIHIKNKDGDKVPLIDERLSMLFLYALFAFYGLFMSASLTYMGQ